MTFVFHFLGMEVWRFTVMPLVGDDEEFIDNTGGEFDLPFGFAPPALAEDEDDEDE